LPEGTAMKRNPNSSITIHTAAAHDAQQLP
jgi:hypothetical protein